MASLKGDALICRSDPSRLNFDADPPPLSDGQLVAVVIVSFTQ